MGRKATTHDKQGKKRTQEDRAKLDKKSELEKRRYYRKKQLTERSTKFVIVQLTADNLRQRAEQDAQRVVSAASRKAARYIPSSVVLPLVQHVPPPLAEHVLHPVPLPLAQHVSTPLAYLVPQHVEQHVPSPLTEDLPPHISLPTQIVTHCLLKFAALSVPSVFASPFTLWLGQVESWLTQSQLLWVWDAVDMDGAVLTLQRQLLPTIKDQLVRSKADVGYNSVVKRRREFEQALAGGRYLLERATMIWNRNPWSPELQGGPGYVLSRVQALVFGILATVQGIRSEILSWRDKGYVSVKSTLKELIKEKVKRNIKIGSCEQSDLDRLRPGQMLSGTLITYFAIKWNTQFPNSLILRTSFMNTRLPSAPPPSSFKDVFSYPGLQNMFECGHALPWKQILIPVHLPSEIHWVLAVVDFVDQRIAVYDSLKKTFERNVSKDPEQSKHWNIIQRLKWFVERCFRELKERFNLPLLLDWSVWELQPHVLCPFQSNSTDCGVFVLVFIYHFLHGGLNSKLVPPEFLLTFGDPRDLNGMRLLFMEALIQDHETLQHRSWAEKRTDFPIEETQGPSDFPDNNTDSDDESQSQSVIRITDSEDDLPSRLSV
ncbi:hypothetical protein EWM64_g810 [Hericium alpestre]|uniref:Ubiquitin-like protease family profile domain-containing protein n=1 Tax=Hericium alpestre TaxID=135208 RepID=A0A4Z0A7Z5_9AGAM|nr:hypothetical protein EWM64_g810 [Hericium alpestre]